MRKLYARYTDDRLLELAVPDTLAIWSTTPSAGASPLSPLGWKLAGWEGWLDTEGLRSLVILDENASAEVLGSSGASEEEIADLRQLIREGQPTRKPAVLSGTPEEASIRGDIPVT